MADSSSVLKGLYRDFRSQVDPKSIQPSVTVYDREKEAMAFQKLFRDIRLQVEVGLKLHQMRRTNVDSKFHEVYTELGLLLDPVESVQKSLFEGKIRIVILNILCHLISSYLGTVKPRVDNVLLVKPIITIVMIVIMP